MKSNPKEPESATASGGVCEHGDGLSIVVPIYNEEGAVAATAEVSVTSTIAVMVLR